MAGLAQAGAAAGTAIMPGIGTAIGGVLGALGDGFMGGGSSSPSGPISAQSAIYGDLGQNNSGWNINFKGVQSNGANQSQPSLTDALGVGSIDPMYLAAGLVLVLALVWKKSHSPK